MLSVICWKWGPLFGPEYVARLKSMLARHLHREHELICITDDPASVPPGIRTERITKWQDTPRCRRRIEQYNRAFAARLGSRILSIDLDVVIVDDITPLVDRREPIVLWKVGYAGVYSGSFVLYNFGALDGLYRAFLADPAGYPRRAQPNGIGSDQAMLNLYLRESGTKVAEWTERDGFVTYFGEGYESRAHHGVGPGNPDLPDGARIVVLGSADKAVLDERRHDWTEAWA